MTSASSAEGSSSNSSTRPRRHSRTWTRRCKPLCNSAHSRASANPRVATPSKDKDLKKLSDLGHFLKGSSAALGLTKIRQSCEKIQNCGQGRTENGGKDEPDDAKSLERIADTLKVVKDEYAEAEKALRKFYAT